MKYSYYICSRYTDNKMRKTIKQIGKISTGTYAKSYKDGQVFYLQARDFDKYNLLRDDVEPVIMSDGSIEKHYLNPGDILVASKGSDNFAALYCGKIKPAVASSMFILIRDIDSMILPEFLVWYLNHPKTQNIFKNSAKGSNLQSINKKTVGEIVVPIPELDKQKAVVDLFKLMLKEKQLKNEIDTWKEIVFDNKIINTLK